MKIKFNGSSHAIIAAVALFFICSAGAYSWDQLGAYIYNSHSVITYDAAMAANETLRSSRGKELGSWTSGLYSRVLPRLGLDPWPMGRSELNGGFFPERHLDDATSRTINRLEEGHTVADEPKLFSMLHSTVLFDAYCGFFTSQKGWATDVASCKSLASIGAGMTLHFKREYRETGSRPELWPAAESCRKAVGIVRALTKEAFSHWEQGRAQKDKAAAMREFELMYFFTGIATHAIQDAFAPAHVQRSALDPRVMEDLCYYYDNKILPPSEAGACAHGVGIGNEPRDSIYFKGNDLYPSTAPMRDLATKATKAYLLGFANTALDTLNGGRPNADAFLDKFLTTGQEEGMGYINCSTLSN